MTVRARAELDRIAPYVPGSRACLPGGELASNESPVGPSPTVGPAITRILGSVGRYPDPLADEVRETLADLHHVHSDQILVSNGADELIYLLLWAFGGAGSGVVTADPSYRLPEICAYLASAEVVKVPLIDWRLDLRAMALVDADIAYICNPHNPTGTALDSAAVEVFVEATKAKLVIVDEAYVDFADHPEDISLLPGKVAEKVVVLRTLSKVYGLAGLRIGYLVGDPALIATLRKIRPPFSVNVAAQAAAVAALGDQEHRNSVRAYVKECRTRLTDLLRSHGYRVVASQASFVLVETDDSATFVARLAEAGVAVRRGEDLNMPGTVRITVPSPKGFQMLVDALDGDGATSSCESPRKSAV